MEIRSSFSTKITFFVKGNGRLAKTESLAKYKFMKKLGTEFYIRDEVDQIARDLLGKIMVVRMNNRELRARIVETEAYAGVTDAASHAYKNKRTARTEIMYQPGGSAYIYHCYGMHLLFNIVTNSIDIPHAVLIRAVEPLFDTGILPKKGARRPGSGPALVTKLMHLNMDLNGQTVTGSRLFLGSDEYKPELIAASPRIGVNYAGNAAQWLYRFFIPQHPHVTPHPFNRTAILLKNTSGYE